MNSKFCLPLLLAALLFLPAVQAKERSFTAAVSTKYGPVIGEVVDGVQSFKGVPYAAPPVGPLRWMAPQPPSPWKNPLLATAYGPASAQALSRAPAIRPLTSTDAFGSVGSISEDCLYLNLWTPAQREKRPLPVIVWLHGGGFLAGSAAQPMYDGGVLASHGVVVVTVEFRLGTLGFVAHPSLTAESASHTSGNYGLLDMIQALRWVRENIAEFGGDPNNVTLMGQSGGGVSVLGLMTSPPARGLFHKAIVHSGLMPPLLRRLERTEGDMSSTQTLGLEFAQRLGADNLASMRAASWIQVMQSLQVASGPGSGSLGDLGAGGIMQSLTVDGQVFEQSPDQVFAAGGQMNIPILIGNVRDEGTMFVPVKRIQTVAGYRELLKEAVGQHLEEAFHYYPIAKASEASQQFIRLQTDMMISISRRHALWMAQRQADVYFYHFTRTPRWQEDSWVKCFHGSELAYVFGHFLADLHYSQTDRQLSTVMIDYWVHFARTGNPNHQGAPAWPAFRPGSEQHLVLDVPIRVGKQLRSEACEKWDGWLRQ